LIFFDLGPPIFFKQKRGGLNGEPFNIIKFRTMSSHGDLNPSKINDEKRTTNLGAILRKFSLDELPTLINIIKGEMSFVGPRPLLYEYKKHYNDDQNKRFLVKPGITGWAQVNGRNKLSWEEKFNLDNWYIKNQTLLLDFKIILMTVKKIFLNTDVDFDKSKDDIKFRGTNENNKS
jgi:lipopolysaccharide/colanic/teichoic acid biosynthesis glycosyltransferase